MTVARINLPGGNEPILNDIMILQNSEKVFFFEMFSNEIILYWNNLDIQESIELNFNIRSIFPGQYKGRYNKIYFYYGDDEYYVEPLKIEIE